MRVTITTVGKVARGALLGLAKVQGNPQRRFAGSLFAAALLALLPGCGWMSFTPPRPAELDGGPVSAVPVTGAGPSSPVPVGSTPAAKDSTAGAKKPARPKFVELLLSRPPDIDRLYFAQFLRRDAGLNKCGLRVTGENLKKPMTPVELATAIRAAASGSIGALILEPIDAPEVRAALHDAEARGLSIVLLDTPLPASSPGKNYPTLSFTGFTEAGRSIVEAVIQDGKAQKLPTDSPILVLESKTKELTSQARLDSLLTALKASGRKYEVLAYEGDSEVVSKLVDRYLKEHPKAAIIVSDSDAGVIGAFQSSVSLRKSGERMVVLGGFAACDSRLNDLIQRLTPALADRNIEGYARKALQTSLDLMDGKPAPERVELPVPFLRKVLTTPPTFTPQLRGADDPEIEQPKGKKDGGA